MRIIYVYVEARYRCSNIKHSNVTSRANNVHAFNIPFTGKPHFQFHLILFLNLYTLPMDCLQIRTGNL